MALEPASILIVDDKPEQLLTLEAALRELGQEIVLARSGREALRCLLRRDFAVILLDVNMPGMDGFETASLIRQRESTRHVPIIFVTAFSDELHVARGYQLGAVDFILSPVVPDMLRTKVGVFIELFRMNAQVRSQADALRRRADQLHQLTEAALAINSTLSLDELMQVAADAARQILGAEQAYTVTNLMQDWAHARCAASLAERYADWHAAPKRFEGAGIAGFVCGRNALVRFDVAELDGYANWRQPGSGMPPLRGALAVPLRGRDGRNIGLILVSEKRGGEFGGDDESLLTQLAQVAAIALENTLYYQAREANRLKDEFLATLSHELRTPLNAILGWAALLRRRALPPEETARGLEVIERNVKVQSRLLEDLLDVSRITAGKLKLAMRPIALEPVVQAALEAVRAMAEAKGLTLELRLGELGRHVNGDPERLQQVVWNLVSNAIKFTPTGGRVEVVLAVVDGRATLHVRDTGIGIRAEFLPYVFDRFRQAETRTTRPHGGLGIGLTIARHLVEMHGGTIRAVSAGENQGATFVVDLPLAAAAAVAGGAAPAEPAAAPANVDLRGLHVLAVDDEPDARGLLERILGGCGAKVSTAASAGEALALLERERVSVLVSDIAMPGADGYDLVRDLRRRSPERGGNLPALALTAFARDEDRARAIAAGFQMHLPKPVDPDELARAVALLAGKASRPAAACEE